MSKLFSRVAGFFSNRTKMGVDKAGNRYFARKEEIDGVLKEKRWVIFKGEDDPTSIPVEWICWLNGQRKKAPTSEEREEMEARRERVRLNVALMKKEEEERKLKEGSTQKGKAAGPDLSSFIRQFPGVKVEEQTDGEGEWQQEREKYFKTNPRVFGANRIRANIQARDMAATNMNFGVAACCFGTNTNPIFCFYLTSERKSRGESI
ncbi:hypothetical protein G4B88_026713 [Cannabis sativa]|uniref:NADH dehydrogenase [ubiquinone] 1 alpha subcomplex subunit 12 n=1 Tax=Cannabis sativa TaxID=3483 RepID=A0A7J6DLG0_CANSA|nr:hypothetical protein G4B88_026713 [Cannabis sativa]